MKISQLRQIIREEIEGMKSEDSIARNLLTNLQKKFKEGAKITLLGFPITSWPMTNFVVANVGDGESEKAQIPYTRKGIESYKLAIDGEPIDLTVFDGAKPADMRGSTPIKGIEYDPFSSIG
jgi:hypothetical protein